MIKSKYRYYFKLLTSLTFLVLSTQVIADPLVFNEVNSSSQLILTKAIDKPTGEYIVSYANFVVPDGMVIQGFNVHYDVNFPATSTLNPATTTFAFSFDKSQGNVSFLAPQGSDTNYFKADYFGESVIKIIATDSANGATAEILDSVFVDFASRRILGGDAEHLTSAQQADVHDNNAHDIRSSTPGMAYLPTDHSRGDVNSDEIIKGFFETTEQRALKTSTGALLQTSHTRRIGSNDAPPGQGVMVSRSVDHGATWGDEILLVQHADDLWGYTGMIEVSGTLYIYVDAGHPSHQGNNLIDRGIYYFTSTDDGETWSEKIRHDQLSTLLGFTSSLIPRGNAVTNNLLKVPGLTIDNVVAPAGQGLLMHTYASGYILGSVDGGTNWIMVADSAAYADATTNGYGQAIYLENEIAWEVLDNSNQDIYALFRRQASSGYKNEYVFSKNMSSGTLGVTFTGLYDQSLANIPARRAHHDMVKVDSGADVGRLIYSTPGNYYRHSPRIAITNEAIGEQGVSSGMYTLVSLYDNLAFGQSSVVYLQDGLANTQGMGKDAIVVIAETEPMDIVSHQIIDLKPDGKGKDERYTTSLLIFSMDYYDALANFKVPLENVFGGTRFESDEGWTDFPVQSSATAFSNITDINGNAWSGDGYIWHQDDTGLPHSGEQVMALGLNTSGYASVEITPGTQGIKEVSFFIKRFSSNTSAIAATVDYGIGSGWVNAWSETYQGDSIPSNYTKITVPINQAENVNIRLGISGTKGLIFDDFSIVPFKLAVQTSFESSEGWTGFPLQSPPTGFTSLTETNNTQWSGDGYIWHQDNDTLARRGDQVLALGLHTSGYSSITATPSGDNGISEVSFFIKRFSSNTSSIAATLEYNVGNGWVNVWSQTYQGSNIPNDYLEVVVPINQAGNVQLRWAITGQKGLIIEDVTINPL
jgi:hypothetical protein